MIIFASTDTSWKEGRVTQSEQFIKSISIQHLNEMGLKTQIFYFQLLICLCMIDFFACKPTWF